MTFPDLQRSSQFVPVWGRIPETPFAIGKSRENFLTSPVVQQDDPTCTS